MGESYLLKETGVNTHKASSQPPLSVTNLNFMKIFKENLNLPPFLLCSFSIVSYLSVSRCRRYQMNNGILEANNSAMTTASSRPRCLFSTTNFTLLII